MFDNDDGNFDEVFNDDLLKDVDDMAMKFYSQTSNEEDEIPAKKRKLDTNTNQSGIQISTKNFINKTSIDSVNEKNKSRHKLILDTLKKTQCSHNSNNVSDNIEKLKNNGSVLQSNLNNENSKSNRRNLVLGILQRKDINTNQIQNHSNTMEVNNRIIKENEIQSDSIKTVNSLKQSDKKTFTSSFSKLQQFKHIERNRTDLNEKGHSNPLETLTSTVKKIRQGNTNSINKFNKQPSLDSSKIFKQKEIITEKNIFEYNPQSHVLSKTISNKKTNLIRKFPGPAGLLPENLDENVPLSILNSQDEIFEDDKNIKKSNYVEYCSQNTKALFSEGAWQYMLDELPNQFLEGYEIATVKTIATQNFRSTQQALKIPFLAGMLMYKDHSADNPLVILRDFSGSINGIMHCDIPLKYPSVLEQNVVVLLHDVGLLRSGYSDNDNKCQILILPSSILAIYSKTGKIVCVDNMDTIVQKQLHKSKRNNNSETNKKDEICKTNFDKFNLSSDAEAAFDLLTPTLGKTDNKNENKETNKITFDAKENGKNKESPKHNDSHAQKTSKNETSETNFADNIFGDSDNESITDEIFTQVDMESIVSQYS